MTRQLPSKPILEQLRHQAKDILKAHKKAEPSCCAALRHLTQFKGKSDAEILNVKFSLREVQFALAMEYGFNAWLDMNAEVVARLGTDPDSTDADTEARFSKVWTT